MRAANVSLSPVRDSCRTQRRRLASFSRQYLYTDQVLDLLPNPQSLAREGAVAQRFGAQGTTDWVAGSNRALTTPFRFTVTPPEPRSSFLNQTCWVCLPLNGILDDWVLSRGICFARVERDSFVPTSMLRTMLNTNMSESPEVLQ